MSVVRASHFFMPTLKQAPADAVAISHQLLVRAGFIRSLGAGLYSYLPLGLRSLARLERILRDEMRSAGAEEFLLPALHPADLWRASGRWDAIDATMFRLNDRRGSEYCLAMTHEEVFTAIARSELRSYRQLPQRWFQISPKFRDEPRPRGGLLRVREFLMKDAYSFDTDAAGLDRSFQAMRAAYQRIYARCALDAFPAQAFSGAMGGKDSIEFVVRTPAGEDEVAHCPACGYTANLEVARSRVPRADGAAVSTSEPEEFPTPGVLTIAALSAPPYNVPPERQLKTLVYMVDGAPVVAVVRGDDTLNEAKLQVATSAATVRPAETEEVFGLMGAHPGSLGAVRFRHALVLVDTSLQGRTEMVTGANRDGFHLRGVDVDRDLLELDNARVADLRAVRSGEGCPECDASLQTFAALEVGHIFKLGTRYSEHLGAMILDTAGDRVPIAMGSYGIGVGRLLAAIVERHHDAHGIIWPAGIAPFDAMVLTLGGEAELEPYAHDVSTQLAAAGLEVLYDDRDERAGVKFNDADLIGVPLRVGIGRRHVGPGTVEWKLRADSQVETLPVAELLARARATVAGSFS
jgi:prolyl-tRNA synthetase